MCSLDFRGSLVAKLELKGTAGHSVLDSRGTLVAKLELNGCMYCLAMYYTLGYYMLGCMYVLYCYKVMLTIKTLLKKVVQKVPKILLFFRAEHPRPPMWP